MPLFNDFGDYVHGIAGVGVYLNGQRLWDQAGGRAWLNNYELLTQRFDGGARLSSYIIPSKEWKDIKVAPITELYAKNNVWNIFYPDNGVEDSYGRHFPLAANGPVAYDGSYAMKTLYQSDGPWTIIDQFGNIKEFSSGNANQINIFSKDEIIWVDNRNIPHAIGLPVPTPVSSLFNWLKIGKIGNEFWQLYQDDFGRLLFHPFDSNDGYIVAPAGNTFGPDVFVVGNSCLFTWGLDQGETTLGFATIDLTSPRVPLKNTQVSVGEPMIRAFERPMWQAPFFSHSAKYGITSADKHVGNSIWIPSAEIHLAQETNMPLIVAPESEIPNWAYNVTVAYWCSGATIEELVGKVNQCLMLPEKPIIAYLDHTNWPQANPFKSDRVWPSIQCYKFPTEAISSFKTRLDECIRIVSSYELPMCLTTRFDDFNGDSTIMKTLECMPLYEDWLRNFNFVAHMPFSDRRGNAISANESLWKWATAFLYAIPFGRPNRYDYWRPEGESIEDILNNKFGQSRAAVVMEPYLREDILKKYSEDSTWPDLLFDLDVVRAQYPELITVNQCAEILNKVAWINRLSGWGLLRKDGGNHGSQPKTGISVSVDWLVNRDLGLGTDCLINCPSSTEGPEKAPANTTWPSLGQEFDLDNWVAPVEP